MEACVKSFRRGKNTKYDRQVIAELDGVEKSEEVTKLVGKKAVYRTKGGKEIKGKVSSPHGNSGALRIRFRKGLPGQIIGSTIEIEE